jgi:proteasome activator subunit 4
MKIIKYRDDFLSLFRLLRDKTFSKRGFSWSGKLLSSTLLTLTHTYPLENKFVNPEEWASESACCQCAHDHKDLDLSTDFRNNHHRFWGKLYKPEDIKVGLAIVGYWFHFDHLYQRFLGMFQTTRK